ncbi:MAG: hypothetical protein ACRC2U_07830 [Aeromonas sp.]
MRELSWGGLIVIALGIPVAFALGCIFGETKAYAAALTAINGLTQPELIKSKEQLWEAHGQLKAFDAVYKVMKEKNSMKREPQ